LEKEIVSHINVAIQKCLEKLPIDIVKINPSDIIVDIGEMILKDSKCFDIVLKCIGGEIKCHKIFLKHMSMFGYLQDFSDNSDITFLDINIDFNHMFYIMLYVYTNNFPLNKYVINNCIEILITVNFCGLLKTNNDNDDTVIKILVNHFIVEAKTILDSTFKKYEFGKFCDMTRLVIDIAEKNGLRTKNSIGYWLSENVSVIDIQCVKDTGLFEKLETTSFYEKFVIGRLDYDNFYVIVNKDNHPQLTNLLIKNEPNVMFEVLVKMFSKIGKFARGTIDCVPVTVFDSVMYECLNDNEKLQLILEYDNFELLNDLTKLSSEQNIKILRNKKVITSCKSGIGQYIIKSVLIKSNKSVEYMNSISDYMKLEYIIITNYYPLKFYYCVYVGSILDIVQLDRHKGITLSFSTVAQNLILKKGTELLLPTGTYEIDKIFMYNKTDDITTEEHMITKIDTNTNIFDIIFTDNCPDVSLIRKNDRALLIMEKF
jgi:hypothetical protein